MYLYICAMLQRLLIILFLSLTLVQCRRDRVDEGNVSNDPSIQLSFSDGTVVFDTIFTSVGSTTRWLKVYNNNNSSVKVSSIRLTGPNNAFFRMNVDGEPGTEIKDVFIPGKDSLFIFVDVTIDPNSGETLPFLVEGNIEFVTNGNVQNVNLLAYGQEAYFITPNRFPQGLPDYKIINNGYDTMWDNTLPIVIYGYAVVDSTQFLQIKEGTQIHFHANSGLWVYRYGQIEAIGSTDNPIVFQGDRLDNYKDVSGSWDRIWINDGPTGQDQIFDNVIIKNSFIGIQAEYNPFQGNKTGLVSQSRIFLRNTVIENTKFAGIFATNHVVIGQNLLVNNSGNSNLIVSGGGQYRFIHSTFANYWRGSIRNTPAVYLTQIYTDRFENVLREDSMLAFFENSIIYGDIKSEFNIEDEYEPGEKINFTMHNTLFKSDIDTEKYGTYIDTIHNPGNQNIFNDPYFDDFSLNSSSPALDNGASEFVSDQLGTSTDLEGKTRNASMPDMGAIEFE